MRKDIEGRLERRKTGRIRVVVSPQAKVVWAGAEASVVAGGAGRGCCGRRGRKVVRKTRSDERGCGRGWFGRECVAAGRGRREWGAGRVGQRG